MIQKYTRNAYTLPVRARMAETALLFRSTVWLVINDTGSM